VLAQLVRGRRRLIGHVRMLGRRRSSEAAVAHRRISRRGRTRGSP
jgi:hypothetical protein